MRCYSTLLAVVMVLVSGVCVNAKYSGGTGEPSHLLASYEISENNLNVTSPDNMSIQKVQGGVGGVPAATDGNYVLKLEWTGDDNQKIEVKHQWDGCFTFDLAGYDEILIDVYIATTSAEPNVICIWDDIFGWVPGSPLPKANGTWITLHYDVSLLTDTGLNHIAAFVFEDLAGYDGTIYLDNLRIVPRRQITFSGYDWTVLYSNWKIGSGPSFFTSREEDVWVDTNGYLHLNIVQRDSNWYCSEVICDDSLGYGTYIFTVQGNVNILDPNIIVGLFLYDVPDSNGKPREIDIELTKWGVPQNDNAQFVVQPSENIGNKERFNIDYSHNTDVTTHVFTWTRNEMYFRSYYGDFTLIPKQEDVIASWYCASDDIPIAGCEKPRINFYLIDGNAPTNNQNAEIIIKSFRYIPDTRPEIEFVDFAVFGEHWLTRDANDTDGADLDDDNDVDVNDLLIICQNWTKKPPPLLPLDVQQIGSWEVDVETGDWAGFSGCVPETVKSLECHVSYGNYVIWFGGWPLLWEYYYVPPLTGEFPFYPTSGKEAAFLYKIGLPPNHNLKIVNVTLKRKPCTYQVWPSQTWVMKGIGFSAGYPYESEPHSYPPDITAEIKLDYLFNSPIGHTSPVSEYNLLQEEIGGVSHQNYYDDRPQHGVAKGIVSYLAPDVLRRTISVNRNVEDIWISLYPVNIQSMKAQLEPYANDALLNDPDIWEYSWGIDILADYSIVGISAR